MHHVLFLGAPGVGKGTYARRVAASLNFAHISPGELLRESVRSGSRPDIAALLASGRLVEESVVRSIVLDRLEVVTGRHPGVIFDGFPRDVNQARNWVNSSVGRVPDLTFHFSLPEQILMGKLAGRRLCGDCGDPYNVFGYSEGEYDMPPMLPRREGVCDKCSGGLMKRADDTEETIRTRLTLHNELEGELIGYLRNLNFDNFIDFKVKTGIKQVPEIIRIIQRHLKL
jgi:adenylate kinase